ncbi:MAG: hypothetical protein JWN34_957 [Bryobacterales bacterium]|nr:hypothetical protein [Bryobacterales bacterium]
MDGRAVAINDSGNVAAFSLEPGRPTFFGSSICNCGGYPIAITNDKRAVFSDGFNNPTWYVSIRNTTDRLRLRAAVVSVSSGGHILEREQFPIPNYFIYVVGTSAEKALSVGDTEPFAINDSDQLLLHTLEGDASGTEQAVLVFCVISFQPPRPGRFWVDVQSITGARFWPMRTMEHGSPLLSCPPPRNKGCCARACQRFQTAAHAWGRMRQRGGD